MTPEERNRLDKLPLWAQDLILRQERSNVFLHKQLAEARGHNPDTNVLIRHYGEPDATLPKDARVTFITEAHHPRPRTNSIEVGHRTDGWLGVYITSGGYLEVRPQASNVVMIRAADDFLERA